MSDNYPTSIYLPKELKQKLVRAAKAEGFEIGRGRRSCLSKFIEAMLQEHRSMYLDNPSTLLVHSLAPELQTFIFKLSGMDLKRQKRVGKALELLLTDL